LDSEGRGIKTDLFIQNVVFLEKRRFGYKIVGSPIFLEHAKNQDDDGELEEREVEGRTSGWSGCHDM
jgi:hypothetical protein